MQLTKNRFQHAPTLPPTSVTPNFFPKLWMSLPDKYWKTSPSINKSIIGRWFTKT
ncbi:hypothetical protein JCM15457_1440 [Liquorilactobacillus sucicola DSM 21376 = JCM 15457]|nr:hypothetical protein JCM15457_1440 [Liquorilactobacillus sucicola DSM 21376 = JCM 15457]